VAALEAWIATLPKRLAFELRKVFVLVLGTGLEVPPMRELRGTDITSEPPYTVLRSPLLEHPVAAAAAYEAELLAMAIEAGDDYVIQPTRKRDARDLVSSLMQQAGPPPPGIPGLRTNRLRATWTVRHLNGDVPIRVLMPAAGLKTLDSLSRHARQMEWPGDEVAFRYLRGER